MNKRTFLKTAGLTLLAYSTRGSIADFLEKATPVKILEPPISTPGLGGTSFQILMDKNAFRVNDVLRVWGESWIIKEEDGKMIAYNTQRPGRSIEIVQIDFPKILAKGTTVDAIPGDDPVLRLKDS